MNVAEHCVRSIQYHGGYTVPPSNPEEDARLAEQAKNFPVTRLPYAGERQTLRFDRRNYKPIRKRLSTQLGDGELSYSDFQNGMHIQSRATANEMRLFYTPEFSKNDEQLQLVLAQQTYSYCRAQMTGAISFLGERIPKGLVNNREALETLSFKAVECWRRRASLEQTISSYRHVMWADAHGGYLKLRAAIAYKAWRLAKDSHTISEEMSLSHHGVRQILNRLCITARRLGLETFPPAHNAYKTYKVLRYDAAEEERIRRSFLYKARNLAISDSEMFKLLENI